MSSNMEEPLGGQPRFSFGDMALSEETGRVGAAPSHASGAGPSVSAAAEETHNEAVDILRTVVMNEQHCPEILQFQTEAVQAIRTLVRQQTNYVDEEEDEATDATSFESQLKRMELDRINYLLRQYYRVRLHKIESFILHITKDTGTYDRLSEPEQKYVVGYMDLVEDHFKKSFLSMLPRKVQVLDKDGNVDHATPPNLDKFVFCRVQNDVGRYAVGPGLSDDSLDLMRGDILCVRYNGIKELLGSDDVQLI